MFNGALDGLVVFMNGSLNCSKNSATTALGAPVANNWLKQAPMRTEASGLVYGHRQKIALVEEGRGMSLDQYYFQPSRSYQPTLAARF